jgi:hypothetical protein
VYRHFRLTRKTGPIVILWGLVFPIGVTWLCYSEQVSFLDLRSASTEKALAEMGLAGETEGRVAP